MMNVRSIVGVVLAAAGFAVGCSAAAPEGPAPSESVDNDQSDLKNKIFCGGIAGFACPDGYVCVDDPSDSCNPNNGGADCGGYCKRANQKPTKCAHDPTKSYISTDPNQCMVMKFVCAEGSAPFFDDCGCGCQTSVGEPCGTTTCGAGEYCCNASCGICAPNGGFCTQQFCSGTL